MTELLLLLDRATYSVVERLGTLLPLCRLLLLRLEPCAFGSRLDLILVSDEILTALEVTLSDAEDALLLLLLEYLLNLILEVLDLREPLVRLLGWHLSADNLCALFAAGLDCLLHDLAVRLGSKCTGTTTASSTSCTTDTVKVDLVALRGFVVDDCCDVLDIETTGSDVGGEQI